MKRFVSVVLVLSTLMMIPISTLSAAEPVSGGPQISNKADPLSQAELARYSQLQADAQQKGTLASEKGGASDVTWIVVGGVIIVAVAVGLVVAAKQ